MTERYFYIDDVNGDDHATGMLPQLAWKTIDRINQNVFYPGDRICFKCNGKWTGMLEPHGDGATYCPIEITSYGEGELPQIDGVGNYAGILLKGVSHYVVRNMKVMNRAQDRAIRQGICVEGKISGITEDILITDCEVTQVCGENRRAIGNYICMYWNSGIYITIPGRASIKNHLHHIHIVNNYVHDVVTSGIRVNQEEDFINDIYHTGIVVRGNRIERTGSDGIIVANSVSPLITGNICYEAGALGNKEDTQYMAGVWVCATSDALIERNEVARTKRFAGDGTAFDTDWGNAGTITFQYNYSHDNEGGFWLDCSNFNFNPEYQKTILRYNVSLQDRIGIAVSHKGLPVEFYGNIFASENAMSVCADGDGKAIQFYNNSFSLKKTPDDNWGKAVFANNRYLMHKCPAEQNEMSDHIKEIASICAHTGDGMKWLSQYNLSDV